jgi:hypothetical protein
MLRERRSLKSIWTATGIVDQGAGVISTVISIVTDIKHIIILMDRVQIRHMEASVQGDGLAGRNRGGPQGGRRRRGQELWLHHGRYMLGSKVRVLLDRAESFNGLTHTNGGLATRAAESADREITRLGLVLGKGTWEGLGTLDVVTASRPEVTIAGNKAFSFLTKVVVTPRGLGHGGRGVPGVLEEERSVLGTWEVYIVDSGGAATDWWRIEVGGVR